MVVRDGSSYHASAAPAIIVAQLLGIASVILMLVWLLHFQEGISVNSGNVARDFNTHPFAMLLGLVFLSGQGTFWFPGLTSMKRANYLPWHAFFGIVIFLMAIISTETGLIQKFINTGLYHGTEALVVNFTGVAVFLFGIATILTVVLPSPRGY